MAGKQVPGGVIHQVPGDLRTELLGSPTALAAWHDITPLARNELICWVEDAKRPPTASEPAGSAVPRPPCNDGYVTSPSYVLVSGPPASGKSAIAPLIAQELHLPLIAKDMIKEALMSVLPVPDVPASQQIGRAAIEAMFAVAAASARGAVLDANLHRSLAVDALRSLPGQVVEVFCRVDPAVARARYRTRAGSRHPGHFDEVRRSEGARRRDDEAPVAGGWPVLEVATDRPVDIAAVVAFVRAAC